MIKQSKFSLNFFGLAFLFFLFWLAVSGSFHWQSLLMGGAASLLVAYYNRNLLIKPQERPSLRGKALPRLLIFCMCLLVDIVKANLQVAAIVLNPRMPISPQMVNLEVNLKTVASRVLLGNSITLTPGTLVVLSEENRFVVHAITAEAGAGLADWELIDRLKQIEGGNL